MKLPQVSVGREDAIPEELLHDGIEPLSLDVVLEVRLQYPLDLVGCRQEHLLAGHDALETRDRRVESPCVALTVRLAPLQDLLLDRGEVALNLKQIAKEWNALGARATAA